MNTLNTPRLRMFAGPNGSGKSTLKSVISDELLGVYINPDEIEQEIKNRVKIGGHNVPKEKIVNRYYKSLELLPEAIKFSNRAYIFDNSGKSRSWLAQINDAKELELKNETVPAWFERYVLKHEF